MTKKSTPAAGGNASTTEFFNDIQKISAQSLKSLFDLQSRYLELWLELLNAQARQMGEAKNPSEFVTAGTSIASEYYTKFIDCSRQATDAMLQAQKDLMECAEKYNYGAALIPAPLWPSERPSEKEPKGQQ